jgi:outer membrane protein assembly factor BamD (BamD/ComL family)
MKKQFLALFCALFVLQSSSHLYAPYLFKNGKFIDTTEMAELPIQDHFNKGIECLKNKDYHEAVHQFKIVTVSFPDAELAYEAYYYLGISYYHAGDMDLANQSLSSYLKTPNNLKHFEQTFRYKLAIGDAFKNGAKKHMFGSKKMPQWFPAKEEAVKVYDEIITSLPNHEITSKALFSKAELLDEEGNFRASREAYQTLIKKFPKTPLAAASYVKISESLLKQVHAEFQNPDLLSLAELNIKKLKTSFPRGEAQIQKAESLFSEMQEIYAQGLYETGSLYERKKEPKASLLYYDSAVSQFPNTKIADKCRERIKALQVYAKELGVNP